MTTHDLEALARKAEKSAKQAEADNAERLRAAVAEAITSDVYGHLSAVARRAGIASQYLRDLVEREHPGWLDEAAARRKERKEATKGKGKRGGRARAA